MLLQEFLRKYFYGIVLEFFQEFLRYFSSRSSSGRLFSKHFIEITCKSSWIFPLVCSGILSEDPLVFFLSRAFFKQFFIFFKYLLLELDKLFRKFHQEFNWKYFHAFVRKILQRFLGKVVFRIYSENFICISSGHSYSSFMGVCSLVYSKILLGVPPGITPRVE